MQQDRLITDEKVVLQAAEAVWAMNKYLVLACSQRDYQEVRKLLRKDNRDVNAAYNILEDIETIYRDVPTEELPQISNALYHIAGYFKKMVPREARQEMNHLIQTDPHKALISLEKNSKSYQINYLLQSRFWPLDREKPFNLVPIAIKHGNKTYQANELTWHGRYVSLVK